MAMEETADMIFQDHPENETWLTLLWFVELDPEVATSVHRDVGQGQQGDKMAPSGGSVVRGDGVPGSI